MDSSRRHWPCGDSGTVRISLPFEQHTLECWEVHCNASLNGGSCIWNKFSPLRGIFGELISDIKYTSNLGNLVIEFMNDFLIIGNTCSQVQGCYMDTWIQILTHMDSSRRHWPCGYSRNNENSAPRWPTHSWMSGSALQCTLEWRKFHMQHN